MPIGDIVNNSDIAIYPEFSYDPNMNCCGSNIPKPNKYPPCPPCIPPREPIRLKKNSVEMQICKLSKKAAAIKKMIENFTDKNKDAVIRIGEASYNFGSYVTLVTELSGQISEEESAYGEIILQMLNDELSAIKEKLKELTEELDSEEGEEITSTEKTVTQ